jgi:hypothetical protein
MGYHLPVQARIANQVKQNFLHTFIHERKSHRDSTYARYNCEWSARICWV